MRLAGGHVDTLAVAGLCIQSKTASMTVHPDDIVQIVFHLGTLGRGFDSPGDANCLSEGFLLHGCSATEQNDEIGIVINQLG